jgi:predicted phage terminase large subunit-like protein
MKEQPTIIRPTPKQREAARVAADNLITLYGGAIRGGKSYWLLLLIFTYAMMYDNSRWAVIRATYTTLKSTLLVTFNKLIQEGIGTYIKSFNHSDYVVTFTNGSQIVFFAENFDNDKELNRFRGLEVNGFGIDEINEIQKETFNKCIERAGSWQGSKGCPIKILATCNPTNNWVKSDFYDRYINNTLPKGWAYVPSKITDNPFIDNNYIESLKSLPPNEYEQFVNGNWNVKQEGVLMDTADLRYFNPNEAREFTGGLGYGDIADEGNDSTCFVFGGVLNEDVYITDVVFNKLLSEVTIPQVIIKAKDNQTKYIRVESNNMGAMYGRQLRDKSNNSFDVLPINSTTNKHTRIIMEVGFIKRKFLFIAPEFQSEEYRNFMKEITTYNLDPKKNKHDDGMDALSGLAIFVRQMFYNIT